MLAFLIHVLFSVAHSLSYGCFMDGCNPQRTFTLGAAFVPYITKQSLKLNWTYSSANNYSTSSSTNMSYIYENNNSFDISKYLGCTTNVETGLYNEITCLFNGRGVYTLNEYGEFLWNFQNELVIAQLSNISSVPLLLPMNTTVINDGTQIMQFSNGIFDWEQVTANLTLPYQTVSKWSPGFVNPEYYSVSLGDGRFALYDYSLGLCWASIYLTFETQPYTQVAVTSSLNYFIYVIGINKDDHLNPNKCVLFAFNIGDISYRIQTRWAHPYSCNDEIGFIGMTVIKHLTNETNPFPVATIISYGLQNSANITNTSKQISLYAVVDKSYYRSEFLWKFDVNKYCALGYLIDPRDSEYGSFGIWIGDYQNNTFLLKQVNISNANLIDIINVNDVLLNAFSIINNWKDVISVIITSRGVSGFSSDMNHYVIVVCVDVVYINQNNDNTESNILLVIDIEEQYLLSWYIFESSSKCVGQLSATTNGKIIIPLSDGMSVIALSV